MNRKAFTLHAMRRFPTSALLATIACGAVLAGAAAQDAGLTRVKERELEAVREQISALKRGLDRRAEERDRITGELQSAEVLVVEKRTAIREIERRRDLSKQKKADLDARLAAKEAELTGETEQLQSQVIAAYTSGKQERLKLLLNQHDPATLGRLTTYYRYMSQYRGENIDAVNTHIAELSELAALSAQEGKRLAALVRARYAELTGLNTANEKRQGLLAALKARMSKEGAEITRLSAEEQDLARLIAELTSILSDYPITSEAPFSALQGKLTWPMAGRLLHDFGQPRAGGLKWNGVVLSAPRGRAVRSIYHGRVVFADWLAGMGLLVIVDHGDGFMSLYGYNETTLKRAGDWVAPGDVIGTAGDSGGQQETGLYFEVRKGARPVNPRIWVSRQPGIG